MGMRAVAAKYSVKDRNGAYLGCCILGILFDILVIPAIIEIINVCCKKGT